MENVYDKIKNAQRIVVKVGTSTLTYETGKLNLNRMDRLAMILSDLHNRGKEIILVSSGAIGVAVGKLGLSAKPTETRYKQAVAAVGQCELMFLYDKLFSEYNNTFNTLLEMGIIPIVNENDTISVEEIEFGDNDTLSAIVAEFVDADLLVLFSDIDGFYDSDPHENPDAKLIDMVNDISSVRSLAGGVGSNRGTGGMITKLDAAEIATAAGIDMVITNGENIDGLYDILDGKKVGTVFVAEQGADK